MNTFFKLFLRVTMRNKMFSALNILGLAIGMAGFIVIMLWVTDELSYDSHNVNASRIYRIRVELTLQGKEFNVVSGNPRHALAAPQTIVLSESMAHKYFGNEDPAGKILRLDDLENYQVTGVYRDFPSASHIHPGFIASLAGQSESREDVWVNNNFNTYVLLREHADADVFEKNLSVTLSQ